MTPISLAIDYADRISKVNSIDELRLLWQEITDNRGKLKEFYKWLVDLKDSMKATLNSPPITNDDFNKEGRKLYKYVEGNGDRQV